MEPKRALSSVDLTALVGEFGAYEGAILDKAYLYGEDFLRLKLRHRERGRVEVLVEVGEVKRAHVADPSHVADAPGRPPQFAMLLRSRLEGASLSAVEQHEFDRILRCRFDRPDESTTIVAELFGDGNLAVLDATGRVLDCLETVRLKSRTVAPGSQYEYPASRVQPFGIGREPFRAHMRESDTDLVRTLATQLNFGGLYAEELCTRAGVSKTLDIADASDEEFDAIYDAIRDLAETIERGSLDPRIYLEDDRPVDVAPVPLEERRGLDARAVSPFMTALDEYFHEIEAAVDEEAAGAPDLAEEIEKYERIRAQQRDAIEDFDEQADREREKAESLYAHYDLADEIIRTVREARDAGHGWDAIEERFADGADRGIVAAEAVRGVHPESGTITLRIDDMAIEVDPTVGVERNADQLYTDAKEIEEKRAGAEEALAETEAQLEALREEREQEGDESAVVADEQAKNDADCPTDWRSKPSVPVRRPEHWYERFRWFHATDDFLVLGGRNADDNEALVRKYLEPGDRFLHAQAHGGPATILKATGPSEPTRSVDFPQPTLEEAAQFAVTYSSVWKDGAYSGDVYMVGPGQVSKTPESGQYLEKGGFAIRGERTYFRDVPVGCAVGIQCEPETRVIGGPPDPIRERAATTVAVEPGRYAQGDVAKRIYRTFREQFTDTSFVRTVASPDEIAKFLPPGTSRIVED